MHLRGDEGNLLGKVDGYAIGSLRAEYEISDNARLFALVDNVLDKDYETFGLFGEPDEVLVDAFDDRRFFSPGAPRAAWVGIRVSF